MYRVFEILEILEILEIIYRVFIVCIHNFKKYILRENFCENKGSSYVCMLSNWAQINSSKGANSQGYKKVPFLEICGPAPELPTTTH